MKPVVLFFSMCVVFGAQAQNIQLLKDVNPGTADGASNLSVVNGLLFFHGTDPAHGHEPWWSDGTTAGTVLLKDLNPGNQLPNIYYEPFYYNGKYYLTGNDTASGFGLLQSDLTEAGTYLFKDFGLNGQPASARKAAELNGKLILTAIDSIGYNARMYTSDGTVANTHLVKPGSYYCDNGIKFLTMNNKMYFVGKTDTGGNRGLWISDGTDPGTRQIYPFLSCSQITQFNSEQFILSAWDAPTGIEPWISNGSFTGTSLIKDIQPGPSFTTPSNYTLWNGKMYFRADSSQYLSNLWVTDGTAQGTSMICLPPPMEVRYVGKVVNGNLLFIAYNMTAGYELWRTDGTQAGTAMVTDINYGSAWGVWSFSDVIIDNKMYFVADDGDHGNEIWVTDGYSASMVYDLNPGAANGYSGIMTNIGNRVFFIGNNGYSGREVFYFDVFPTGISEVETAGKLNIYPNPANNTITVDVTDDMKGATVTLLNSIGQVAAQYKGITANKYTLDISALPVGIYMLELQNNGATTRGKLVKN